MNNKHTPGPWRHDEYGHVHAQVGQRNRMVAECFLVDERLPNARLIAAAPDMLEALKFALECAEVPVPDHAERVKKGERLMRVLRDAIAKAEGRK